MDQDEEKKAKIIRDRWKSGNTWGIVGIFFLLLAGSRFGSGPNGQPGSQIVTGQPEQSTATALSTSTSSDNGISIRFDPRDATYVIEGAQVTLTKGISEQSIPNSSAKIITKYFGNGALGDLNGDGRSDLAYYLTVETGGSGLFYYVVAAINQGSNSVSANPLDIGSASYKITNPVLIGDRIAPQPSEIKDSKLYINYADRKEGEAMTDTPSVGMTKILDVDSQGILRE